MGATARWPLAIVLADGLTNTVGVNGRDLLDRHMGSQLSRIWVDYEPFSRSGTVETTDVYPYFFGLDPSHNPGRAGLELILNGDLHMYCDHFMAVRTSADGYEVRKLAEASRVHVSPSKFSADGRSWLVCAEARGQRDRFSVSAASTLPDYRASHAVSPVQGWRLSAASQNSNRYFLLGWCHGALLSAFAMCDISQRPGASSGRRLDAPSATRTDREKELGDYLHRRGFGSRTLLLYLKDSAWAARRGEDKIESTRFTSQVLKLILRHAEGGPVVVISDHNSEIGRDETLAGATSCGVYAEDPRALLEVGCAIDRFGSRPLLQSDLVAILATAWA
ncbi:hypothetical protein HLY00_2050 [Mycolicibacterium hippocampi]|uniref:Uncharacterized protein n=1 Tax=Mycolicibacterium hippocampi TaxID=659824 RepID=A0A850PNA9_9MYCO|nr:hypothetical protein [Mycolicibacterium hippocampi]